MSSWIAPNRRPQGMNLGYLTLLSHRGWGREFGNVSEADCSRSCDGRRTGVQRHWPWCGHRERGTTRARRRGSAVAARSRPWGRLGPWSRSRLGRQRRLGLRWKLGLRAGVGLCHRSVWARHLVPVVADRFGRQSGAAENRHSRIRVYSSDILWRPTNILIFAVGFGLKPGLCLSARTLLKRLVDNVLRRIT